MGVFTPDFWNDIGVVTFLILFVLGTGLAFQRGWVVLGFTYRAAQESHKEVVRIWEMSNEQLRARSSEDQSTIHLQASTIAEQKVSAELTEHVVKAIREAREQMTQ